MDILNSLKQLRDDLKYWVTINLNALNAKIDEKTIPIDNELDSTSTNPVQNKAIASEINDINNRVGDKSVASQISSAIAAQPHFSGDYNDLTNAPNIAEDGAGNMIIADESGNIIFKADTDGIHTTALSLNGEAAATESYVDTAIDNIEFPEIDLTDYYNKTETDRVLNNLKEEISESIISESEEWKIVDGDGNIIFSVDADGAHTTSLNLDGKDINDIMDNKVASLVDSAPSTLNTLNELAEALGDDPNFATTITTNIGKKVDKVDGKQLSTNDFTDEYKNALDNLGSMAFEETDPTVPAWAKAENKPTYTAAEVGLGNVNNTSDADKPVSTATQTALDNLKDELSESIVSESEEWTVVDSEGNVVATINDNGIQTTSVIVESIILNGVNINDVIEAKVRAYINEAILGGAW